MLTMTTVVFLVILGAVLLWKRGSVTLAVASVFYLLGLYSGDGWFADFVRSSVAWVLHLF